jgi:hypothetical protein
MENKTDYTIDEETIERLGLRPTDKAVNAQIAPDARVFAYPLLENVFIMESDLYGNKMPKDSCFLAFTGQHGLVGMHIQVETLKNASPDDIRNMVENNSDR